MAARVAHLSIGAAGPLVVALGASLALSACTRPAEAEATPAGPPKVAAASPVEAGRYLIIVGGCNDCHTPGWDVAADKTPESQWLIGSPVGWRGPWGTTYPSNLRLLAAKMTEDDFVTMLKTRKDRPPMPWSNVNRMNQADVRAIYAYLKHLGPAGTPMPLADRSGHAAQNSLHPRRAADAAPRGLRPRRESPMPMTREQMDRKLDEHFHYEATDNVEGVLATLTADVEHDIVGWPTGPTHGPEARAASMRRCSPTCRTARSRARAGSMATVSWSTIPSGAAGRRAGRSAWWAATVPRLPPAARDRVFRRGRHQARERLDRPGRHPEAVAASLESRVMSLTEKPGRPNQKRRTRKDLLEAAARPDEAGP